MLEPLAMDAPRQPRAVGQARVGVQQRDGHTHIATFRQQGSLKLVFPRTFSPTCQAVSVNTAGGVTGGDSFRLDAAAGADTRLTITTQAAERAYRAVDGSRPGRVDTRLTVAAGATLNWVPQETILFDGCNFSRRFEADVDASGTLVFSESVVFGRTSSGERLRAARFTDTVAIRHKGQTVFRDAVHLTGDIDAHLAQPAVAAGCGAMANVVVVGGGVDRHLDLLRQQLPERAGASMLTDAVLVVRILATDGYELRKSLIPLLTRLTQADLPKPWMT